MDINKISPSKPGDIRQRLGAKDEKDTTFDDLIFEMSPKEVVAIWTGWVLGSNGWGHEIIDFYESLK